MDVKKQIKELWKTVFQDDDAFIDLYFKRRFTADNNIYTEMDNRVVAALQTIPYPMTYNGLLLTTSYISGALTAPEYRGHGIMRKLLERSFKRMKEKSVQLSILIPAEPSLFDYYATMGYAPVFTHSLSDMILKHELRPDAGIRVEPIVKFKEEVYFYFERMMLERPTCVQHSEDDFKMVLADLALEGGKLLVAHRDDHIAGLAIAVVENQEVLIKECLYDDKNVLESLIYKLCEMCGCESARRILPASGNEKNAKAHGMARIIDAGYMLKRYAATHPPFSLNIDLVDEQLTSNSGVYHIERGKCTRGAVRMGEKYLKTNISLLTQKIFMHREAYMSLMLD